MSATPKDNMKDLIDNNIVLEDTVIGYDPTTVSEYRKLYQQRNKKVLSQTEFAKILKLNDASVISRIERGEMGMDARTYAVFLLLTDNHPNYKLKLRSECNESQADLILHTPTANEVKTARSKIVGLSQRNLSLLIGLHPKMINKYESSSAISRNRRSPSPHTWTMLLLAIKQHPYYELIPIREAQSN